jgi:probable phosphoglycerate mutase
VRAPRSTGPRRRGHRKRRPLPSIGTPRDDGQAGLTLEIYLARHGETEWSVSGRHTGTTDLPLTERGEEKATTLGERLMGIDFDAAYSSPMQRALRTAQLAGFPNPGVTPLLKEADYGEYEGLTSRQIHSTNPGWELYHDGSPGGESPAQIYARAQRFIALATTSHGDPKRIIAFAHGHILRAIAVAWIGADITVAAGLELDVATLNMLRDGDRGRVIGLWNEP